MQKITSSFKYPKQFWWCIGIFGLICMVIFGLPALFTQLPSVLDFTGTGEIGDTIGGIHGTVCGDRCSVLDIHGILGAKGSK